MPTYEYGDMWSAWEQADLFLVTTNSYIKKNGALVMGRGIAKAARDRFLGIDEALGQRVKASAGHLGEYRLLISRTWPKRKFGAFQVKTHFRKQADLGLIRRSAQALAEWAKENKSASVHLNFPGIGNGGLGVEAVQPVIEEELWAAQNVRIWRFASEKER